MLLRNPYLVLLVIYGTLIGCKASPMSDTSSHINKGVTAGPVIRKEFEILMKNTGQYPYIALIQTRHNSVYKCAAVIIKVDIVLTVAHCTEDRNPNELQVLAGTFHSDDVSSSKDVQISYVKKILNHPKHRKIAKSNNDIAIVWVELSFTFGELVRSINLMADEYSGERTFALGWGVDETGKLSKFLMRADFIVIANRKCKDKFADTPDRIVTPSMICAKGTLKDQSMCVGDSGGPLIYRQKNKDDILVGLSSWGMVYEGSHNKEGKTVSYNYCNSKYPSVFTNVQILAPWVLREIRK